MLPLDLVWNSRKLSIDAVSAHEGAVEEEFADLLIGDSTNDGISRLSLTRHR